MSGTSAPTDHAERSANCAVAISTYTGVATSAIAIATTNAIVSARSRVPGTRATSGRAITARSTNSPSAAIIDRNMTQRAVSSDGVAAVSDSDGITNCGAGPAFGPTENVNAPRTGWPSAEMTRQKTRYQPSPMRFSGTASSYGFDGDRSTGPLVSWWPAASVTETTAKRGSITSS